TQLTLETLYSTTSYTVPELSATYDPQRKVIEGTGLPKEIIQLLMQNGPYGQTVSRQTIAQPDGSFGLDISDMSLILNSWATITMIDSTGNQLHIRIQIRGYTLFLPIINRPLE
ncbi:MAG TPA: hypothetical protein PK530_06375, partial [Anaerolineales bacterium]|nr:hypothetical protein [Anaerolineales bacterium]